ncbi:MAG: SpoIIE family protein phosphatase, partial [bacterium]
MSGETYIDTGYISLIKHGEQLCGDRVMFARNENTRIGVLADGLGSGVKANILATLTSQILTTMSLGGMSVEDCVNTIVRTLPESSVRKIAYSTFTLIKIRDEKYVELTRFDNPHTIVLRNGKHYDFDYHARYIDDKKIYESRFEAQVGDVFVVISDGVNFAGLGGAYPFGWGRENAIQFLEAHYDPEMPARRIARTLAEECLKLYEGRPGDDTTIAVMRLVNPHPVNMMIGPPSSAGLDEDMLNAFFSQPGKHIVCGGSTNIMAAKYLGKELTASLDYFDSDIPPMYELEGVDLSTEGALTISRVLEFADEFLSGTQLRQRWEDKR